MTKSASMDAVNELIIAIIEKEYALLLDGVKSGRLEPQNAEAFKITRWLTHIVHGEAVLRSYLNDLAEADKAGRNLVVDKFARVNDAIPRLTHNPRVEAIAQAETQWMREAAERYPHVIKAAPEEAFRKYVSSELETLSDATLELYFGEVQAALVAGRNFVEVRHSVLCRRMGTTLRDKEALLARAAEK